MAMHPDFAWIPTLMNIAPGFPIVAATARMWDIPGLDRHRERRFVPKPSEPIYVFDHWLRDYASEAVDADTVADAEATIVPLIDKIMRYQGKPRFLCKLVGRPVKIELLHRLFPDAAFIHLTRDLKPTVASLMRVEFYERTREPIEHWKWDRLPDWMYEYYERSGRTAEVAAAITVALNEVEIRRQLSQVPRDLSVEIGYRQFVNDPIDTLRATSSVARFDFDDRYVQRVNERRLLRHADDKWKSFFTSQQVENLSGFEEMFEQSTAARS